MVGAGGVSSDGDNCRDRAGANWLNEDRQTRQIYNIPISSLPGTEPRCGLQLLPGADSQQSVDPAPAPPPGGSPVVLLLAILPG